MPAYTKPSAGVNGSMVCGLSFAWIGNTYTDGAWGYGAILLTDSSSNTRVARCRFVTVSSSSVKVRGCGSFTVV